VHALYVHESDVHNTFYCTPSIQKRVDEDLDAHRRRRRVHGGAFAWCIKALVEFVIRRYRVFELKDGATESGLQSNPKRRPIGVASPRHGKVLTDPSLQRRKKTKNPKTQITRPKTQITTTNSCSQTNRFFLHPGGQAKTPNPLLSVFFFHPTKTHKTNKNRSFALRSTVVAVHASPHTSSTRSIAAPEFDTTAISFFLPWLTERQSGRR